MAQVKKARKSNQAKAEPKVAPALLRSTRSRRDRVSEEHELNAFTTASALLELKEGLSFFAGVTTVLIFDLFIFKHRYG